MEDIKLTGFELRKAVAETFMGWLEVEIKTDGFFTTVVGTTEQWKTQGDAKSPVPEYEKSIGAAIVLAQAMRMQPFNVKYHFAEKLKHMVTANADGQTVAIAWPWAIMHMTAEQICQAALWGKKMAEESGDYAQQALVLDEENKEAKKLLKELLSEEGCEGFSQDLRERAEKLIK